MRYINLDTEIHKKYLEIAIYPKSVSAVLFMSIMTLHIKNMFLIRIIFSIPFNDLQNGFHTNYTN